MLMFVNTVSALLFVCVVEGFAYLLLTLIVISADAKLDIRDHGGECIRIVKILTVGNNNNNNNTWQRRRKV